MNVPLGASMKKCYVVLERLDERVLNPYLRKSLNTAGDNKTDTSNQEFKNTKNLKNATASVMIRQRKEEVTPLNAPETNLTNSNSENSLKGGSACSDLQAIRNSEPETEKTVSKLEADEKKDELLVETGGGDSRCGLAVDCHAANSETEEIPRHLQQNLNCDEVEVVCREKFATLGVSQCPEEDCDSRDGCEDDKETILFEKDTDLEEVLELEEKETSAEVKDIKIAKPNKERQVKLKRERITERSLEDIKKRKTKLVEEGSAEKSPNEIFRENCLNEMCDLVKRLNELCTVIEQLQKEMPKDPGLAVHFKKVISAQQSEIGKTQKSIIKCLENMLVICNNNVKTVALEIGKRTYLNAEEIFYLLSLCFLSEGSCDVDKSRSGSWDKTEQQQNPSAADLERVRIMSNEVPARWSKSKGANQEVIEVVIDEPATTVAGWEAPPGRCVPPVGLTHNPQLSNEWMLPHNICRQYPPPAHCNSQYLTQQNFENDRNNNSTVRHTKTHSISQMNMNHQQPMYQTTSSRSQYCNIPYDHQNFFSCPRPRFPTPELTVAHRRQGNVTPSTTVPTSHFPLPYPSQCPCNYQIQRPTINQTDTSNCPVSLPIDPRYSDVTNRVLQSHGVSFSEVPTGARRKSVKAFDRPVLNGQFTLTPYGQCRQGFPGSAEPQTEKFPPQVRCIGTEIRALDNPEVQVPQVLAPTIPRKLTMKDHKLQAGPFLDSSNMTSVKFIGEGDSRERSKSRIYICALNGCENPGTRICPSCHSVIYCSETCQLKHWNLKHRPECCQLKELRG